MLKQGSWLLSHIDLHLKQYYMKQLHLGLIIVQSTSKQKHHQSQFINQNYDIHGKLHPRSLHQLQHAEQVKIIKHMLTVFGLYLPDLFNLPMFPIPLICFLCAGTVTYRSADGFYSPSCVYSCRYRAFSRNLYLSLTPTNAISPLPFFSEKTSSHLLRETSQKREQRYWDSIDPLLLRCVKVYI